MTEDDFRKLALALPEAVEGAHQGHPDFRLRERIFASLGPDGEWGMVKLPAEEQARLVAKSPAVFEPFAGAWGRQGCTKVHLATASKPQVQKALRAAWECLAAKRRSAPNRAR